MAGGATLLLQFIAMTPVLLLGGLLMAAAATYLLIVFVKMVSAWWQNEWLMEQGEKLDARIVEVKVMDDSNRVVPFVRMKLEVNSRETFFCTAEGFYHRAELPYLQAGNIVSAVLHPIDKTKAKLVKVQLKAPRPKAPTAVLSFPSKQTLSVA